MHDIHLIPAFNDNYIFAIVHPGNRTVVLVDPGDAEPVKRWFSEQHPELSLVAILVTHHHQDHTGGIPALKAFKNANNLTIYGPGFCDIDTDKPLSIPAADLTFKVLAVPGHTLDHIAYFGHGWLFCGDTLFAGGCGKVFEGTYAQMFQSLQTLAALPENTKVYCAHEYTLANLEFALKAEPNNSALQTRYRAVKQQRSEQRPTIPSIIAIERATNPFLRLHSPDIINTLTEQGHTSQGPIAIFKALRLWKNRQS